MTLFIACADEDEHGRGVDPPGAIDGVVALDDTTNKLGPALYVLAVDPKAVVTPVQTKWTVDGRAVRVMLTAMPNRNVGLEYYRAFDVRRYGDVYSAYIPIDQLTQVAGDPSVKAIRAARRVQPTLEISVPTATGIDLSPAVGPDWGTGMLAGVVDTGIYTGHPDFTNGSGVSRIVDTWDQNVGPAPYSGSYSIADSPGAQYSDSPGMTYGTMASPVDLTGRSSCSLGFAHMYAIEDGYDFLNVQVSSGGGAYATIATYTGHPSDWSLESLSLAGYEGDTLSVRFEMATDAGTSDLGWYGDDVTIDCADGMMPANLFFDDFESGFGNWTSTTGWGLATTGGGIIDPDGHGTNVSSIMAGRGVANTSRNGVARNADIAVVGTTFYDADITAGVEHIFKYAANHGQKSVVNLSLGSMAGPHDGRDPFDRAMDAISGPGQIVVTSAGNSGDSDIHVHGVVDSTTYESIQWDMGGAFDLVAFDVWHDSPVGINVRVKKASGTPLTIVPPGSTYNSGGILIINYLPDPGQPTNLVYVQARAGGGPNNWQILMAKTSAGDPDANFDAWMWYTAQGAEIDPAGDNVADAVNTIGSPATGFNTISVGAWVTKDYCSMGPQYCLGDVGDLAIFSSRGPTTDGRTIDITAPGSFICAACSPDGSSCSSSAGYLCYAGTSQASPHAAGMSLLGLQQNPNLGPDGLRSLLYESANRPGGLTPAIGTPPSNDWGWGKLDADPFIIEAQANDPSSSGVTVGPATRGSNTTLTARGGAFASSRNLAAGQRYAYQWQEFSDGLWRNIPYAHYQSIAPDQFSSGDTLRVVATPVEYLVNGFHGGNSDWFYGGSVVSGSISISGDSTARGYTASEEWTLVSVPTADIPAAGFLTNPLYEWNETTQSYAVATTIQNGHGYFTWIEPAEGAMSSGGGSPGTSDYTVVLSKTGTTGKPGRHLIGNPFPFPIYWQNLLVDGEPVETSSKVQNYYYGNYSNGAAQYHVYQVGHLDGKIPPWTAFWVVALQDGVTLTIPYSQPLPVGLARDSDVSYYATTDLDPIVDPGPAPVDDPELTGPTPLHPTVPLPAPLVDWQLQIQAVSGDKRDDYNYVGMARDAADEWDKYDVYDPGTLGDAYVVVAVNRDDRKFRPGRYCRDVQLMRRRGSWPVDVSTKGLTEDVTLVWGDVPAGWELELVDEVDGVTVNMTESGSYSFTPSKGTGLRRFTVNAVRVD